MARAEIREFNGELDGEPAVAEFTGELDPVPGKLDSLYKTANRLFGRGSVMDSIDAVPAGQPRGLVEPGNIDLGKRPKVKNADGTISTVRSMGINDGTHEVLIPTVHPDGYIMADDEAVKHYRTTGRHLGKFTTPEESTAYAERLHEDQAKAVKANAIAETIFREQAGKMRPTVSQSNTRMVDGAAGVAEVAARRGIGGLIEALGGAVRGAGDTLDIDTIARKGADISESGDRFAKRAQLKTGHVAGFGPESVVHDLPEAAANAGASILQTAPGLIANVAVPGSGLPLLFAQTGAQEYGQGREAGLDPTGAVLRAIPQGAAEVIGEKVGGFDALTKGIRAAITDNGIEQLGRALVKSGIRELPGEELTTTLQFLTDKAPGIGINQEATLADYTKALKDTALATLLQSGAMTGGGAALQKTAQMMDAAKPGAVPPAVPPAKDVSGLANAIAGTAKVPSANIVEAPADLQLDPVAPDDIRAFENNGSPELPAADEKNAPDPQAVKDLTELAHSVRDNPGDQTHRVVTFGRASGRAVSLLKELGIDAEGYVHVVDNYAVRHAFKKHGDDKGEAKRGQIGILPEDFARIPEVVTSPDSIELSGQTSIGRETILYKKRINGHIVVVEEARNKKGNQGQLALVSMWKARPAPDASSLPKPPAQTSETFRAEPENSVSDIAQPGKPPTPEPQAATPEPEAPRPYELPLKLSENAMQVETPTEGLRPGDVIGADGKPFTTKAKAAIAKKNAGKGWAIKRGNGGFVVRYQPQTKAQIAARNARLEEQDSVDTQRDSMFAVIAKLGGINAGEVKSEWGLDDDLRGLRGAGIKRVATANGLSIDTMGEALAEYGYLSVDEHGKYDRHEFEDLFGGELGGSKHYTPEGYEHAASEAAGQELEGGLSEEDIAGSGFDGLPEEGKDAVEGFLAAYDGETEDELEARLEREAIQAASDEYEASLRSGAGLEEAAERNQDEPDREEADDGSFDKADARAPEEPANDEVGSEPSEPDGQEPDENDDSIKRPENPVAAAEEDTPQKNDAPESPARDENPPANAVRSTRPGNTPAAQDEALSLIESESEQSGAPRQKIDDFGEVLRGARKEYAAAYKDARGKSEEVDIAAAPLSKSWPEPDYQKLLDDGADPWLVGFVRAARDEIPTKPQKSYKQRQWVEQVQALRGMAYRLLDGSTSKELLEQVLDRPQFSRLKDVMLSRVDLYGIVGHGKSLKGISLTKHSFSFYRGVSYKPHKVIWIVEKQAKATAFGNWPRELGVGDTREEAIEGFKRMYDSLETGAAPTKKEIEFVIYSKRGKDGFYIGKKTGKNYIDLKFFDTVALARAYKDAHHAELVALLEKKKEIPNERRDTNLPRIGADHRGGTNITPQAFSETFGFRGVQFGNYVEGARRQEDLNNAYDGLMDMAGILGIPPKAISLNGELGLAFGARGQGGRSAGAAHYEGGEVVINLTKARGAGSLAHEWWHSLDNYFSRRRGAKNDYMTEALDVSLASRGSDYLKRDNGVRPEMVAAYGEVLKAINASALVERSKNLDSRRSKDYWSTKLEMTARAFESYIINKLNDQGQSNDYLANIVSDVEYGLEDSYPYPTAAEIPAIRAAYDHFFNTVQSKETESGVALFSAQSTASEGETAEAVRAAIAGDTYNHEVDVYATMEDAPDYVQRQAKKEGITPEGFYDPRTGRVAIIASNVTAKRAVEVARHELIGHYGLENMVGKDEMQRLAARVIKAEADGNKAILELARHVDETQPGLSPERRAKEIIAVMAERNLQNGIARRVMDAIRKFLKSIGFTKGDITDAQISTLLREAQAYLREQGREMVAGQAAPAAFSTVWHGTPHIWPPEPGFPHGRPRLDKMGSGEGAQAYGWGWYSAENQGVAHGYRMPNGAQPKVIVKGKTLPRDTMESRAFADMATLGKSAAIQRLKDNIRFNDKYAPDIADMYRQTLARVEATAIEDVTADTGQLYKLDIPDTVLPYLLDWDKTLRLQTPEVQKALDKLSDNVIDAWKTNGTWRHLRGSDIYRHLAGGLTNGAAKAGRHRAASEQLASIGILGNRYLDGLSRGRDEGTYNFVIWHQPTLDKVALLKRNEEKLDAIREAEAEFSGGLFDQEPTALEAGRPLTRAEVLAKQAKDEQLAKEAAKPVKDTGKQLRGDQVDLFNPQSSLFSGKEAAKQTDTPAFKRWFGDSKAVDENGKPLVVYHGTTTWERDGRQLGDIKAFDRMASVNIVRRAASIDTVGSWFSTNPGKGGAAMYGNTIYPVYLSIKNPHETTFRLMLRRARLLANGKDDGRMIGQAEVDAYRKWLRDIGKDGVKIVHDDGEQSSEFKDQNAWIALEPEQIKSAIGNNGEFDPESPEIHFSGKAPGKQDKIEVDGQLYPKTNSDGQRIHPTDEGTKNFWRWFNGSQGMAGKAEQGTNAGGIFGTVRPDTGGNWTRDKNGSPRVFYHGTKDDFSAFDLDHENRKDAGWLGRGVYVTSSIHQAELYANQKRGSGGPLVMPLYVAVHNPYVAMLAQKQMFSRATAQDIAHATAELKHAGFDGVALDNGDGSFELVAFDNKAVKSAIGNKGTYNPENEDILFSGKQRNPFEQGDLKLVVDPITGKDFITSERDTAGRKRWVAGRKMYDAIARNAVDILGKVKLADDAPLEFKAMMRAYRVDLTKAQANAEQVAKIGMAQLTAAERKMLSDVIEGNVAVGDVPPETVLKIATEIQAALKQQAQDLVELGMIDQSRLIEHYLPRAYRNPLLARMTSKDMFKSWYQKARLRIAGSRLKSRGLVHQIRPAEWDKYQRLGWKLSSMSDGSAIPDDLRTAITKRKAIPPHYPKDLKFLVWRDFTQEEREQMGEIHDGLLRYALGYVETQRDIAVGRLFKAIANNQTLSSNINPGGWAKVPDEEIIGADGIKRYGALSGRYVPEMVRDMIERSTQDKGPLMQVYDRALNFWKEGKTVWNPVAHGNNIVSNVFTIHFAGLNPADPRVWRGTIQEYRRQGAYYQEAVNYGLFGTEWASKDIQEMFLPDLIGDLDIENISASRFNKVVNFLKKTGKPVAAYRDTMQKAYEFEDQFFKLMLFIDRRKAGASIDEAINDTERYVFNYADIPEGVETLKRTYSPFISYTYKALPMLVHTALTRPDRLLAPIILLGGANWLAYAMIGGDEDEERKNMPEYLKGRTAIGTPKSIRMPFNVEDKPAYMDMTRRVPLGDLFDLNNQTGGIAAPAPMMPSHPLFTASAALFFNVDTFTGKDLTKASDTDWEAAQKRADWIYKQIIPNAPFIPGSWNFDKLMNGAANAFDTEMAGYTGYTKAGDATPLGMALLDVAGGTKIRAFDPARNKDFKEYELDKERKELMSNIRSATRNHAMSPEKRESYIAKQREKMEELGRKREALE